MIQGVLYRFLLKAILVALIALILYGVFPGASLIIILMLFVGLRLISLVSEALRKPASAGQRETMVGEVTSRRETPTPEERAGTATSLELSPRRSARDLEQARVNKASRLDVAPRSNRELVAEALGLFAFLILIPLDIALYTRDIVSVRSGQGWEVRLWPCSV